MDSSVKKMLQSKKVAGLRQVVRGVRSNQIRCVLLADNADLHIKAQIREICTKNDVPITTYSNKEELGKELGIDLPCAVVGFIK